MQTTFDSDKLPHWRRLLAEDREQSAKYYFEAVLPDLVTYLEQLETHVPLRAQACDTLVSLMGFSPETTVICTALLRPRRVLTIRSKGVDTSFNLAASFLIGRGLLDFSNLFHEQVDPADPVDIYETIRRHVRGEEAEHTIVDVTGGKKVMSASAAVAASELGIPLCYIDGKYDAHIRRPEPGTERLLVLPNPSTYRAEMARKEALSVYETRDFANALRVFQASAELQPQTPQFEELSIALCKVYMAWADLDLQLLGERIEQLTQILAKPNVRYLIEGKLDPSAHLRALQAVAGGDQLALLTTFLQLGEQYQSRARHDFACLLAYRALEGLVQYGLAQAGGGDFDVSSPDYAKLGDPAELERRFLELAAALDHDRITGLPRRIGFIDGFMLLCLVDEVHKRFQGRASMVKATQSLATVARKRNQSVLAHGHKNLTEKDSAHILFQAEQLGKAILGDRFEQITRSRQYLRPLPLRDVAPEH